MKKYYLVVIEKKNGLTDGDIAFDEKDIKDIEARLEEGDICYPIEFCEYDGLFESYVKLKNTYEAEMVALDEIHIEFDRIAQENYELMLEVM